MKYIVQISELVSKWVEVTSDTAEQAIQQVTNDYYNGDIILTSSDCVDGSVQVEVVSKTK